MSLKFEATTISNQRTKETHKQIGKYENKHKSAKTNCLHRNNKNIARTIRRQ